MNIYDIIILALGIWRIANILANEDGPLEIFEKLRHKLGVRYAEEPPYDRYGTTVLSQGMICVWCSSVWLGIAVAILYNLTPFTVYVLLPFSLSTIAVLIDSHVDTNVKN